MQPIQNKHISTVKNRLFFPSDNKGSVLVVAVMVMFVLSLIGIFALNTTDFEIKIASNQQNWEKDFNVTEGGAKIEGTKVGYTRTGVNDWYEISDPETFNQYLLPPGRTPGNSYDPGSDMDAGDIPGLGSFDGTTAGFYELWPHENLLQDPLDDLYDYTYLVTYLFPDVPPKGYDSTTFSGYKFRLNGEKKIVIEIGGIKVGVKSGI